MFWSATSGLFLFVSTFSVVRVSQQGWEEEESEQLNRKFSFSGACLDFLNSVQIVSPSNSSLDKLPLSTWLCQ